MWNLTETTLHLALAGRWMARAVGLLCILFVLAFVVAEGPPPVYRMTGREAMFAAAMAAMFAGLALAWRWEAWGGGVVVLAWVVMAGMMGEHPFDPPFLIPGATGVLHLLCAWRLRGGEVARGAGRWGALSRAGWVLVTVFVVLCANEMFGQPPLMAPREVGPEAVGEWTGMAGTARLTLRVAADGTATGSMGVVDLGAGRLEVNRSWFGRWMHWRSDYIVRVGNRSLHVDVRDGVMEGTMTTGQRAQKVSLRRR